MDAATFRALGHELVDQLATLIASVPSGPVARDESATPIRAALDLTRALPESGTDPAALLRKTATELFAHSLFNQHPRFFGYITAPPAPIGVLGDLLASALNPNVSSWRLAPAATEIELQTVRWIAEFIGFPTSAGGLLVSGGNMANFVCFFAARAAKAPWKIRETGMAGGNGKRLIVYGSAEMHTWIQKAADLSGLGTASIRWIETDAELRMDVAALARQVDADRTAGYIPFLVVGTAGSVATGAVDALDEIGAFCKAQNLWFHVDGAYGGFAAATPEAPAELKALASADSVAVDPHKWLYAPLEAGCALVRDAEALRAAFAYHSPYYHFGEQVENFVDFGFQNSRGFRALKVWLGLSHVGAAAYRQMIADDIALARRLADVVRRTQELELFTQSLSITTFRFVPADLRAAAEEPANVKYLNDLNTKVLDHLQRHGEAFVSNAVVDGRYVLRACVVNFHTEAGDIDALPEIVVRAGRELHAARSQEHG